MSVTIFVVRLGALPQIAETISQLYVAQICCPDVWESGLDESALIRPGVLSFEQGGSPTSQCKPMTSRPELFNFFVSDDTDVGPG